MTITLNANAPSPFVRILAALMGLGVMLALLFFGALIAAVAAAAALGAGVLFWLRGKFFPRPSAPRDPNIIEGEFEVIKTRAIEDERAP
jgi:hypothetical protein